MKNMKNMMMMMMMRRRRRRRPRRVIWKPTKFRLPELSVPAHRASTWPPSKKPQAQGLGSQPRNPRAQPETTGATADIGDPRSQAPMIEPQTHFTRKLSTLSPQRLDRETCTPRPLSLVLLLSSDAGSCASDVPKLPNPVTCHAQAPKPSETTGEEPRKQWPLVGLPYYASFSTLHPQLFSCITYYLFLRVLGQLSLRGAISPTDRFRAEEMPCISAA